MTAAPEKKSVDALSGVTILVVDDSETVSKLIGSALEAQGHNVEAAVCGQEAFDWLQSVEPDLLLLDYSLPDFNGNVLIERLAEQGREIPFIIITGHGDEKIAVEMMKLGAIDYLVKDEAFMELLPAVVEQALRSLHNQRRLLAAEEKLQVAEQDLVLKESRFSELFIHMSSGVAVFEAVDNGADFVFVDLNEAAERIENVVRDEMVGRRLREAFPAAEDIGLVSALRRAWQSGEEQNLPAAFYRDGRIEGWREISIYRLPTGEVVVIYDDVTEKKRAEQEVLESRRQLETLMANIPGMAYRCRNDRAWTMELVSEGCRDLLGCSPEDLIGGEGVNYADLIHPDDRSMVWQQVQEAVEEKRSFTIEYRIRNLDGQERWVWEQGRGVHDPDGSLEALEGLVVDITERKKAEAILKGRLDTLIQPDADVVGLSFENLFDLDEIQKIQDAFAKASGVSSIITDTEGRPITKPSNFCRLCKDIIRKTEKGLVNCMHSDTVLGRVNHDGPNVQPCLSGGLWDGGASICVGDRHIATWLVGQVRNEELDIDGMLAYAREIGADEEEFRAALAEVSVMSTGQFRQVCEALFVMAKQLSSMAYRNVQQARAIHERDSAQAALRDSEERLALALESSNEGVWDWDLKTGEVFFGPGFLTMLGYEPDELPASLATFEHLLHPEDKEAVMARTLELAASGEQFEMGFRMRTKAGEHVHILSRGKGVAFDAEGCPTRLVGTHVDISERHHYEKQVLKVAEGVSAATGESFFRSLVKHLAEVLGATLVGVSEKLPDSQERMRVIALNDRDVEMGGFEYEIEGTPCELLIRGEELTVSDGVKGLFSRFAILDDRPIEGFVGTPIVDSSGEVIGALFAFFEQPLEHPKTDESMLRIFAVRAAAELERERREEELRLERTRYKELYQQFQTILEGIPDQISLLSPELEVLWSNRQGAMPGVRASHFVGRHHCFESPDEQPSPCEDCYAVRSFATGEKQDALLRSGERTFGVKFFPLQDEKGRVHSVISLASDITEKRRLQEEAERASRLASLGEIAAGVAHEINNPNALILLNASVLIDVMGTVLPMLNERFLREGDFLLGKMPYSRMGEEVPRLQREVVDSAKKIRDIVEEMRGFVKQGGLVAATQLDLNDVAARTLRIVRKINPDTTIESSMESTLPAVRGNGQQLEQVLINLVQNGVDALGGQPGKVSISTGCSEEGSIVFVEVCDEGTGIPEDCLAKITDPFFTTKREEGGTGLGLSISARIIKDHEGTLQFFSRPDKGTRVRLELPISGRSDK